MGASQKEIGGERFSLYTHRRTKSDAETAAENIRAKGYKARIFYEDMDKSYAIYIKKA